MSAHESQPTAAGGPVEIRLRGEIGEYALSLFEGFEHTVEPMTTTVRGTVADEAELTELRRRIRDAGIELVALRRLPETVSSHQRREGVA